MDDPFSCFLLSTTSNSVFLEIDTWIAFIVLILLLVSSAMISGSEVAFFSLSPTERLDLKENKEKAAETATELLNTPKCLLATILIANNFLNVGIVILSSYILLTIYPLPETGIDYLRSFIEIAGITFIILLIGEIIPKIYANRKAMTIVLFMAKPISWINKTPPFSWLRNVLVNGSDFIVKSARKRSIDVSTDDLENAIALTREDNDTEDDQRILEGIVNFGNTDVKQIMRSRVDTIAVDEEVGFLSLIEIIVDSGYSRIPVFKENFDEVTGIIYVKDLLPYLDKPADFKWTELTRQPFFVPENKKIDDLLKEFQGRKMHMAVVVDEYGGASGIVTLEDVLEEIVGEITDEFDDDDIVYTKIDDKTYLFEGKTALVDMYKVLEIDGKPFEEIKGESDSIAGFLVEQSGRILKNNEIYSYENLKFIVESSDKKRIKMVKIRILDR